MLGWAIFALSDVAHKDLEHCASLLRMRVGISLRYQLAELDLFHQIVAFRVVHESDKI
jgi:hypothetical protein